MRQAKRLFLFLPLLLSGFLLAFHAPEDDFLDKIITRLTTFQLHHPQEKVYLHLDKPNYVAGEDIWYKAYLVDARSHAPDVSADRWFAMTRLDENRAKAQLAKRAGVPVKDVTNVAIWGNH